MNPQKPTPRIDDSERRRIKAELDALSDDGLIEDIHRSRSMRRHPFATRQDAALYGLRISMAKRLLTRRFRRAIENYNDEG